MSDRIVPLPDGYRKVRPVAPLDAERQPDGSAYYQDHPWAVDLTPSSWGTEGNRYTDAEFAAAFMPAELFDAVLDAARENAYRDGNGQPCECRTCVAVRAYDAHRQTP